MAALDTRSRLNPTGKITPGLSGPHGEVAKFNSPHGVELRSPARFRSAPLCLCDSKPPIVGAAL